MNAAAAITILLLALAQPQPEPVNVKPCVEKGLKWLAAQQKEDGSWIGPADTFPTVTTAMAGLALLMEGSTLRDGTYAPQLQKAVAWFEKQAQQSGLIRSGHVRDITRPIPAHAHAILFLACAYDVDNDPVRQKRLGLLLERAITFAGEAQNKSGAWTLTPSREIDGTSNTTDQMLHALFTARKVGIDVPQKIIDKAVEYLTKTIGGFVGIADNDGQVLRGASTFSLASGATAALLIHDGARPVAFSQWVLYLQKSNLQPWSRRPAPGTLLSYFNVARIRFLLGEDGQRAVDPTVKKADAMRWSAYREPAYRAIRDSQSAEGGWDVFSNPIHTSAVALILLQLENQYVPAFTR